MKPFLVFLGILVFAQLQAQEKSSLDWDIDSIFNEPAAEPAPEEPDTGSSNVTAADKLKQQSFVFNASYEFITGIMPGWLEPPWSSADDYGYFLDRAIKLRSSLGMDAQIDKSLRVISNIYFEIPNFSFRLGDFFFDYNLYDFVFFRGGKYAHSWGISPNYNFTDLLARIPPRIANPGESFIIKADVPTGIGGFQVLAMTRADLMISNPPAPKLEDFGFGGKYNLALRAVDFDVGIFYQEGMALRNFLSVKTTLWKTELYSEGLAAIDVHEPDNISGAVSIGFVREFFEDKFSVNGEFFYNAEKGAYWYRPESNIREAGSVPFIEGLNLAINLRYKFGGKADFRLFTQLRYAPLENSAQLIPGFMLTPWPHIDLYFAVPMALGDKDGYYSRNTLTVDLDGKPIPFRIMILISLSGSIRYGFAN
jgi:hypothetical protein